MRVENIKQNVIRPGYEENTEHFRQLRYSEIFSPVWLASPFVSLSQLCAVVQCQPSLLPELLLVVQHSSVWKLAGIGTNTALETFHASGTYLSWPDLALNAL